MKMHMLDVHALKRPSNTMDSSYIFRIICLYRQNVEGRKQPDLDLIDYKDHDEQPEEDGVQPPDLMIMKLYVIKMEVQPFWQVL